MELQQLQSELSNRLKGEITETNYWYIPVHTLKVSYKPILKTKMDILMKMILLSLKEATIKSAEELSEIILVEELFIADLMKKMQKTGLIEKIDNHFQLTRKGKEQLQSGVYEEEQPVKTVELLYSPVHQSVIDGDIEDVLNIEDYPEQLYRHYTEEEQVTFNHDVLIQQLQTMEQEENEEENNPLIIQSIDSIEPFQINDVPCIELLVKEDDRLKVKVWNTLRNNWDHMLEREIVEKGESSI